MTGEPPYGLTEEDALSLLRMYDEVDYLWLKTQFPELLAVLRDLYEWKRTECPV